jgi:hypothetical protein
MRKQIYIETQTPRSSENLCKLMTKVYNKEERERAHRRMELGAPNATWRMQLRAMWNMMKMTKNLHPQFFLKYE